MTADRHAIGRYSRNKGKRGERAFCLLCKEHGYDNVHRTAQVMGKTGEAGDVEGLPGIHVEVKNQERMQLYDWLAQSVRDAEANGKERIPIVAHKKNNADWIISMKASDWFKIYREYEAGLPSKTAQD